jgi:response regulator RpfG family c-di-GMP phosphodiesterase
LAEDYDVVLATSTAEADQALTEHSIDLILLDIVMPEEDGFVATHSDGTPLDQVRIDDGSVSNIHDVLIARTPEVHEFVRQNIARQETLLRENRERFLDLLTP